VLILLLLLLQQRLLAIVLPPLLLLLCCIEVLLLRRRRICLCRRRCFGRLLLAEQAVAARPGADAWQVLHGCCLRGLLSAEDGARRRAARLAGRQRRAAPSRLLAGCGGRGIMPHPPRRCCCCRHVSLLLLLLLLLTPAARRRRRLAVGFVCLWCQVGGLGPIERAKPALDAGQHSAGTPEGTVSQPQPLAWCQPAAAAAVAGNHRQAGGRGTHQPACSSATTSWA
jgi:hypothetical protein